MTHTEVLARLRRLAEEFRALGLSDYARGRADLHGAWCDAASRIEDFIEELED